MAKRLYQTLVLNLVVGCIAAACVCQKQSFRMNYTIASGILFPVVVRKCELYLDDGGIFERGNILDLPTVEPPCCCKSQWRYRVGCYYTIIDFLLILLTVPRRCFFCGSFMLFLSCLVCFYARLFVDALWSPAWKGLTSWLSFVMFNCDVDVVTFPLVSWVRCGA